MLKTKKKKKKRERETIWFVFIHELQFSILNESHLYTETKGMTSLMCIKYWNNQDGITCMSQKRYRSETRIIE